MLVLLSLLTVLLSLAGGVALRLAGARECGVASKSAIPAHRQLMTPGLRALGFRGFRV